MPRRVAGSEQRAHLQASELDDLLVDQRAVHAVDQARGQLVGQDRRAELLRESIQPGEVVMVMVGEQDRRDLQVLRSGRLDQRLDAVVAVDEHARGALLVAHEVGVGEPVGVLGALEDHE
jgi:hypothetical protein